MSTLINTKLWFKIRTILLLGHKHIGGKYSSEYGKAMTIETSNINALHDNTMIIENYIYEVWTHSRVGGREN